MKILFYNTYVRVQKTMILVIFGLLIFFNPCFSSELGKYLKEQNLKEKYADYPAVIAFDSIFTKVQESGLSNVTKKVLYYIVKPEASKEFNTIILDYEPLSADITIIKAFIIRENGNEEELFNKKIYDYTAPARAIYWGARQKMMEPGYFAPGDAVYIEYLRKGYTYALLSNDDDSRFIPPMRGHFYDIIEFYNKYPVHSQYFKVILPASKEMIYKTYNGDFVEKITETSEFKIGEFSLQNILPIKKEFRIVDNSDIAPKVIVTTTSKWEEKSKWFYGVNEDYGSFNSTPEIDKKVAEILKGAKSELDSIERLNRWCADEIRYSGISMGEGEGYTLHTGDMTFTDRCGVCKDKAGMLVTMLRAAGFKSYAAMTMAGSRIEDIPADQFNHSVTAVQLRDGSMLMLDPTWVPFVREMWSSREQQQNYIIGLKEGDILRETPISSPDNHYLKINNIASIDKNGTITGTITVTAEGQSDAQIRSIFTRSLRNMWEYNLKNQIYNLYPTANITKANYSDPYKYYENPVNIEIKYSIPNFAAVNDKTMIIEPMTAKGVFKYAQQYGNWKDSEEKRKYGFTGACSQQVIINEEITLPAKAKLISHKKSKNSQKGNFASIDNQISIINNVLKINSEENYNQRVYPVEAWDDFSKIFKVKEEFNQPVIVEF